MKAKQADGEKRKSEPAAAGSADRQVRVRIEDLALSGLVRELEDPGVDEERPAKQAKAESAKKQRLEAPPIMAGDTQPAEMLSVERGAAVSQ